MDFTLDLQSLGWLDALFRVMLAMLFGFCLGYDRSIKNKPIDFRVYMIVATTTCLLAIMGNELYFIYQGSSNLLEMDILRLVEGVLVGIGFLGAGAIIKGEGQNILGSATGASIWSAGAMGLMLGFGLYGLAILGFLVLAVTLILFGRLRGPLFHESEVYHQEKKTKSEDKKE